MIKERFENALAAIRQAGFHADLDTEACCRSCAVDSAPMVGTRAPGVLAHERRAQWSADGNRLTSLDGYDERTQVKTLYFNFASIEAARACRAAFRKQKFIVTWNGRMNQSVRVSLAI